MPGTLPPPGVKPDLVTPGDLALRLLAVACANCRFQDPAGGLCRRDPPRPRYATEMQAGADYLWRQDSRDRRSNEAVWPIVRPLDWCGDFDPAAVEPFGGWTLL